MRFIFAILIGLLLASFANADEFRFAPGVSPGPGTYELRGNLLYPVAKPIPVVEMPSEGRITGFYPRSGSSSIGSWVAPAQYQSNLPVTYPQPPLTPSPMRVRSVSPMPVRPWQANPGGCPNGQCRRR